MTTIRDSESTVRGDAEVDSLERLRDREAKLREKAQQLQARAEHLERVRRTQHERLARRVDAHQKIILGALVQKAGLDWTLPDPYEKRGQNDDVLNAIPRRLDALSVTYDRERILAALMWLAEVSKRPANDVVSVPDWR
jgi:uncharacterized protein YlxW (UPF0749 family)